MQQSPKKIRRIGIYNVQGGNTIDLYTNDFKHAASTIAALYRSRWKIEIFFRNLKQNLHIKSFLGTSQNAVEIQIWTALITILLLQYIKRIAKHPWCLSNLTASLRLNTFTKIDLFQWINEPFSPPSDEPEKHRGDTPVYRKCQGAIDPLDSYLTPILRQKRLGHYWNYPRFLRAKYDTLSRHI